MFQKGHKHSPKSRAKVDFNDQELNKDDVLINDLVAGVPKSFQVRYKAVLTSGKSKSKAIVMKCAECCNFEDVTDRVKNCTVRRCPLWACRPGRNKEGKK